MISSAAHHLESLTGCCWFLPAKAAIAHDHLLTWAIVFFYEKIARARLQYHTSNRV